MHRLLRSLINLDASAPQGAYLANFQQFLSFHLEPDREDDLKIWGFLKDYYNEHVEAPTGEVVFDHFKGDVEAFARLKEYEQAPLYIRTGFTHIAKEVREQVKTAEFLNLLAVSKEIVLKGVVEKDKKSKLKGLGDAVPYLMRSAQQMVTYDTHARVRGNFRDDANEVRAEYMATELDKGNPGKVTGVDGIDKVIKGIRKGQLWIHAAYVGELKSTFAMNWCYHMVVHQCCNVFYASLEMPYEDLRRQVGALHSTHPKWGGREPLSYETIRDGLLTEEEKAFFGEVWDDFENNPDYGDFHCWCPSDDITTISDIRREAEIVHKESELDLIAIDHGGLVDPEKLQRHKDYTIQLNTVLRGSKKLALHFDNGNKIPVLLLFQINREGKEHADKNQGRYKLKHLSYANEAERSADIVTTSYLNEDLRAQGIAIFDNLKRRDGPLFQPVQVRVLFPSYRIYNLEISQDSGATLEEHTRTLSLMDQL